MLIGNVYLSYGSRYDFFAWFRDYPLLLTPWGSVILALTYIYASATVALGIRFSNLTYRGLVTNGPYAFCKHPAYVAKNASWWMISLPFLSQEGLWTAISHSLLLIGVNLLYFLRARTEERHLSHYPEYVAYAEAMNTHSLFAPLARAIPYLQYRKPDPLPTL